MKVKIVVFILACMFTSCVDAAELMHQCRLKPQKTWGNVEEILSTWRRQVDIKAAYVVPRQRGTIRTSLAREEKSIWIVHGVDSHADYDWLFSSPEGKQLAEKLDAICVGNTVIGIEMDWSKRQSHRIKVVSTSPNNILRLNN